MFRLNGSRDPGSSVSAKITVIKISKTFMITSDLFLDEQDVWALVRNKGRISRGVWARYLLKSLAKSACGRILVKSEIVKVSYIW